MRGNKEAMITIGSGDDRASFRADGYLLNKVDMLEKLWDCKRSTAIQSAVNQAYEMHIAPLLSYALTATMLDDDGKSNTDEVKAFLMAEFGVNEEIAAALSTRAAMEKRTKKRRVNV